MQVTPRGAGLVVAVLQDPGAGDLSSERVGILCNLLSLDPRWAGAGPGPGQGRGRSGGPQEDA